MTLAEDHQVQVELEASWLEPRGQGRLVDVGSYWTGEILRRAQPRL